MEHLREFGQMYGFTPEQIDGMEHPRVVFVPDEELPYDAATFARFNAEQQKRQSKPEQAVKLGKTVPEDVFRRIVGEVSRYDRLPDFYADDRAVASVLGELVQAGVVNEMQLPELRTGGSLSAVGREFVENVLIGKAFEGSPDAVRQVTGSPTLRQSVVTGLNEIAHNRTLTQSGYDLSGELAAAIDLVHRAKAAAPQVYKPGVPVSSFARQQGLFDDEHGDSRVTDATVLLLADVLNSGRPGDLRKVLATYNNEAASPAGGQMDMFSGGVASKEELLNQVNEYFKNATPREQQAAVDAAVAERKRRAEASGEAEEAPQHGGGSPNREGARGVQEETRNEVVDQAMSHDEAIAFIAAMESRAEVAPSVDLSIENWDALFGKDGIVNTPIGEVKMGDNQFTKMMREDRHGKLGMVKPTLENPDVILEDASKAKEGDTEERPSSYIFVKAFKKADGSRYYYFTSITVSKDGREVVVSNQEKRKNAIANLLSKDKLVWKHADDVSDASDVAQGLYSSQGIVSDLATEGTDAPQTSMSNSETSEPTNSRTDVDSNLDGKSDDTATRQSSDVSENKVINNQTDLQGNPEKSIANEGETSLSEQIAAASAEVNTEPTEGQKEAGNYKKGHVQIGTFNITIEQPEGSVRRGTDANGKAWETKMHNTYGYFRGTEGVDGDHIDVFLTNDIDGWNGRRVYIVDQYNEDGTFDEHKVMLGFNDMDEAKSDYLANYEKGWEDGRRIDVSTTSLEDFEKWIQSSHRKTKPFAEYAGVKKDKIEPENIFQKADRIAREAREKREKDKVEARTDNQGNPTNADGTLKLEQLSSMDELTDEDFSNPARNVALPALPAKVDDAIGAEGKTVVIKKNIFEKNKTRHKDLTPSQSRDVLSSALYYPDLYGQNKKATRPYNWILIHNAEKHSSVILEVNHNKDNVEIVNWHYLDDATLKQKERQAVKEGGLILTLESAAGDAQNSLSSRDKVTTKTSDKQKENKQKIEPGRADEEAVETGETAEVLVKGGKWDVTGEPEKFKRRKKGDSHDVMWQIGKKRYGSTVAESDAIAYLKSEHGGYVGVWNAYERGEVFLSPNEAAIVKAVLAANGGVRLSKSDGKVRPLTVEETALRDAVVDRLRESGIEVIDDVEEGQRVLELANEARESKGTKKAPMTAELTQRAAHTTVVTSADGAKVIERLDNLVRELENLSSNRRKTFLGDIAKAIGAERHGSSSQYATFEARNGKVFTIRLANHNASVSSFDNNNEAEGISVVVSGTPNQRMRDAGEAHVVEFFYPEQKLRKADGKPLAEIVKGIKQALYSGEYKDTTGLAEVQEVNRDIILNERASGADLYKELEEAFGSDKAASGFLSETGFVGVSYPAQYASGGRVDGARNYVIFNESDMRITDHVRFFRTSEGEAYGFTVGGKIYIDPRIAGVDTPIHEYAHLWASALRQVNPEEWKNVVELMKGTPVWDEVRKLYPNLETDEEIADEVLATYSGRRGAERLREEQRKVLDGDGSVMEKAEAVSALERVRRALQRFWKGVADFLHIHYTSAEEVADRVMKDLLEGVDPRKFRNGSAEEELDKVNERFNEELNDQLSGSQAAGHIYALGRPSDVLLSTGIPDLPIELAASRLAMKSRQQNHPFDMEALKDLPKALQHPIAVFSYGDKGKAQNIIIEIEHKGKNFVVGLHLNQSRRGIEVNDIRGLFPKDTAEWLNWINQGKLLYADKEKIQTLIDQQRINLAEVDYLDLDSAAKVVESFENPSVEAGNPASGREAMRARAEELSERLHTPVRIVGTDEEVSELPSTRRRRAKGWTNTATGEVVIVIPNHADVADVENTVLHEVVGHDGLRVLFPTEERLNRALDELYRVSEGSIRDAIDAKARKLYAAEVDRLREKKRKEHEAKGEDANAFYYVDMADAHVEASRKREELRRTATEEYGADLAGRIGEEGFERMSAEERTFWGRLKAMLQRALQRLLDGLHISGKRAWTDKEWAFVLHESYKRKKNGGRPTLFDVADTEVMRWKTGFGETTAEEKQRQTNVENMKHKVADMFIKALNGEFKGRPQSIGRLTSEGRAYLEQISGIRFKEHVDFVLNPSDLLHIYKEHFGENEKDRGNNEPLTMEDIKNMVYVISSPDRIVYGTDREGKKLFFFLKAHGDGTYNLAEVYGDKRGNLTAKSFYNTKKKGISQRVNEIKASLHTTSETSGEFLSSGAKIPTMFEINEDQAENIDRVSREASTIVENAVREGRYMKAPNGAPSKLDARQWVQVRTSAFKAWAGDWENDPEHATVVLDENGEPLVVYHGTDAEFTTFDPERGDGTHRGMYFTDSKEMAASYKGGKHLMPVFLNLRDVYEFDGRGRNWEDLTLAQPYDRNGGEGVVEHAEQIVRMYRAEVESRRRRGGNAEEYAQFLNGLRVPRLLSAYRAAESEKPGNVFAAAARLVKMRRLRKEMERYFRSADPELSSGLATRDVDLTHDDRDGIIFRNIRDYGTQVEDDAPHDVYVVYDPNNIKSATGNNGEFSRENNDIMFRDEETEDVNERFNEELGTLTEKNADSVVFSLGRPSAVLKSAGVRDMPMKLYGNKVMKKMRKHGFALEELRDLPRAVADPIAVFNNYGEDGNRSVLTELHTVNGNFLVAISLGKGKDDIDFNIISSVFGKGEDNIVDWLNRGFATYINKEKALNYLHHSALRAVTSESPRLNSATKVVKDFVNPTAYNENVTDEDMMFRDGDGALTYDELSMTNDPVSKVLGKSIRMARQRREFAERERGRMVERVQELAETLHLDNVDIVTDASTLEGRRGKAKGFYSRSTGKITIVIPNHSSVFDAEQTLLHEAVAHYGLRQLFGAHFDTFLDNVYRQADTYVRNRIESLAQQRGLNIRTATEEYLASLAENTDFENMGASWWSKIKELFLQMLHKIGFEDFSGVTLSDNELRYILWRSYENLAEPGRYRSILGEAADVAKQNELKVGNYAPADADVRQVSDAAHSVKAERIRKLRNSKPVEITGNEIEPNEDLKQYKKNALEYGKKLRGEYTNKDTGETISLTGGNSRGGIREILQHDYKDVEHLQSIAAIPQIIENSIFIDELSNEDFDKYPGINSFSYYVCGLKIGKEDYTVKAVIANQSNGERYYDHKLTHIEKGKLLSIIPTIQKAGMEGNSPLSEVKDKRLLSILQADEDIMFRDGDEVRPEEQAAAVARTLYEEAVRDTGDLSLLSALVRLPLGKEHRVRFKHKFAESFFDYSRSVKALQDALEQATGRKVESFEDAWKSLNTKSSMDQIELDRLNREFIRPLSRHIGKMIGGKSLRGKRLGLDDVEMYMNAVHGLERNRVMAERDAEAKAVDENGGVMVQPSPTEEDYDKRMDAWEEWRDKVAKRKAELLSERRDYSGLTALFGEETQSTEVEALEDAARRYITEFEATVGRDMTDELWRLSDALNGWTLRKAYLSGLIGKEQYEDVRKMYQHYVPLRGWHDDYAGDVYSYISRGSDSESLQSVMKRAYGRKSRAAHILGTMAAMANMSVVQGNKNLVAQKFLNCALNTRDAGLLLVSRQWYVKEADGTLVPDNPTLTEDMSAEEMQRAIEQHEQEMEERSKTDARVVRRMFTKEFPYRLAKWQEDKHRVRVLRNGVEYQVYVLGNPRAAMALNGLLNPDSKPGIIQKFFMAFMRFRAKMLTSLNVEFWVGNFQRDVETSLAGMYVKHGGAFLKKRAGNLLSVLPGIRKGRFDKGIFRLMYRYEHGMLDMNDPTERMFREFCDNGGITGISSLTNSEEFDRQMNRTVREVMSRRLYLPKEAIRAFFAGVEFVNRGVENATRFAAYMTMRSRGENVLNSVFEAKNASVNFNMKGSGAWGNLWMRRNIVFTNAALQALRMLGEWYGASRKRFFGVMGGMVVSGYLNALLCDLLFGGGDGDDDDDKRYGEDDWYRLSEWNRYNFLNIGNPFGHGYLHWSISQEFRPAWALGQIVYDLQRGRLGAADAAKKMAEQVNNLTPVAFVAGGSRDADDALDGFIKGWTPTLAADFLDAYHWNKDFLGYPITNQHDWNVHDPEWQRASKDTPKFAVELSRRWNNLTGGRDNRRSDWDSKYLNPSALCYLAAQQTGGVGTLAKKLVKMVEQLSSDDEKLELRNIPFMSKFYVETGDDRSKARELNERFMKLWSEFEAIDRELRKNDRDYDEGKMSAEEVSRIEQLLKTDGSYALWERGDRFKSEYEYLRKLAREGDEEAKQDLEELKREFVSIDN